MSAEVDHAPAAAPTGTGGAPAATTTTWRYIGLYGHSVGTLTLDTSGLTWKSTSRPSSQRGGGNNDDDEDTVTTRRVPAKLISTASWTVFGRSGYLRVTTKTKDGGVGTELRFDGFPEKDYNKLADSFDRLYGKRIGRKNVSCSGASFGVTDIHDKNLVFRESLIAEGEEGEAESGEEIISLDLTEVTQCVLPGNNRNEIELQFHESDTVEQNTDQLVQIRFYVPPDPDTDPTDKESLTAAELFQQRIVQRANIKSTTGNVIAKFDEVQGTFLTPRGRYTIELYDRFLRLRGNKYDYKIKYDDISRLFLLPKPDEVHMAFVIALDKPIRQGQQRYQYLVMQTTKAQSELTIHLDEETLQKEYNGDLQPVMQGSLSNLVAKTFKVVTGKKVFVPGKFANANQYACVKCALRANEGHLYPLEKQFIFIHKPSVLIRFDEVESVEFQRYAGGQGSTRNFDLCVALKHGGGADGGPREYVFSGIDRSDYAALYSFLSGKKIRIKNLEGMDPAAVAGGAPPALLGEMTPAQATAEAMAMMEDEDDESSEDEDYESGEASSGSEAISDDGGGSGSGSDDDDDDLSDDSDLEEYRKKAKEEAARAAGKRKAGDDDAAVNDDDGDDFIVDDEGDSKKKKKNKKKGKGGKEPKAKKAKTAPAAKKAKKKKDPNAPKKYLTSFMIYSNSRRAAVREDNPDASFGEMGKIIGAEWKKLTDEEKKEWNDKSAEDKVRYEKEMAEYEKTKEVEEGGDGGASDDDDGEDDGSSKKKKKKKKKDKKEKKKKKSKEKAKGKTKSKSKKKKREASSEDEDDSEEEASADSRSSGDDSD